MNIIMKMNNFNLTIRIFFVIKYLVDIIEIQKKGNTLGYINFVEAWRLFDNISR
jgi:hypothetical protein